MSSTDVDTPFRRLSGSPAVNATIFFLFVLIGVVYIVSAKVRGINPFEVTFGPVLIMLIYSVLIGAARLLRLRDDQSGDNLYYMGFLFTLTSLGVSLYQFDADEGAEIIVQNFGVAVASTIAGVALRVFFNQMRRDPIEVEASARAELADASRRVRRELDNSVLEFSNFRRALQQTVSDGFDETRAKVDEIGRRLLAGVEGTVHRSGEILDGSFRDSTTKSAEITMRVLKDIESATQSLASEVTRLSKSAAQMAQGMDAVFSKLNAMRDPENVIEIKLAPAIQGLTRVVNAFSKGADTYAAGLGQAVADAEAAATRSATMIEPLRAEVSNMRETLEDLRVTLVRANAPPEPPPEAPKPPAEEPPPDRGGGWWGRR